MARIRTVKPEFFRHEALYDAEMQSGLPLRIAFAGLFTAADKEGRFSWKPRSLKLDCLPHDTVNFESVLDALHEFGFIVKYEIDGKFYGAIPSWKEHQHVNIREAESKIPGPTGESMCMHVTARGEGKGREGERKGTDISTRESRVALEFQFGKLKEAYPKRDGSNPWKPAFKVFCSAARRTEPSIIIAAAQNYKSECDRKGLTGTDKVAQCLTWLRQERFDDYKPPPDLAERTAEQDAIAAKHGYKWDEAQSRYAKPGE